MKKEALSAGYYHSSGWNKNYSSIQILTIVELLYGAEVQMPPQYEMFEQAERVQQSEAEQQELDMLH